MLIRLTCTSRCKVAALQDEIEQGPANQAASYSDAAEFVPRSEATMDEATLTEMNDEGFGDSQREESCRIMLKERLKEDRRAAEDTPSKKSRKRVGHRGGIKRGIISPPPERFMHEKSF